MDLRERLVVAVEDGMSSRSAARIFGVGASTAITWVSRWRREGRVFPHGVGGDRRSGVVEAERDWLLACVTETPDMTLEEIRTSLRERGVIVGYGTVWRFFERHGISVKKNRARRRTEQAGRRRRPDRMASATAGA